MVAVVSTAHASTAQHSPVTIIHVTARGARGEDDATGAWPGVRRRGTDLRRRQVRLRQMRTRGPTAWAGGSSGWSAARLPATMSTAPRGRRPPRPAPPPPQAPATTPTSALAGGPGGYYSYDVGGRHVIALNSECGFVGGCGTGSPEVTRLRADLAAHTDRCTLVYSHRPPLERHRDRRRRWLVRGALEEPRRGGYGARPERSSPSVLPPNAARADRRSWRCRHSTARRRHRRCQPLRSGLFERRRHAQPDRVRSSGADPARKLVRMAVRLRGRRRLHRLRRRELPL